MRVFTLCSKDDCRLSRLTQKGSGVPQPQPSDVSAA